MNIQLDPNDPNLLEYSQLAAQAGDLGFEIKRRQAFHESVHAKMEAVRQRIEAAHLAKEKAEVESDQAGA